MSLASLVREDNWQGFDQAWSQAIDQGAEIDELLMALVAVAEKRRMPRCLPRLRDHAAKLAEGERFGEAAQLVGAALLGGGSPGELWPQLLDLAEKAWGSEAWWARYAELTGFETQTPEARRSWRDFREMIAYKPGTIVFHAAGWGVGEVQEVDAEAGEARVRFEGGKTDVFPLRTAVDIFRVLPDDDLRTQSLRDKDGLKRRLKEDPLAILRAILARYNGRATSVMVKNALTQVGVTGNAWTSWWRKARLLAENDPWFKVSGRGAKVEVQLLSRAQDPAAVLRQQLQHAPSLLEAQSRVRELLGTAQLDDALAAAALDMLSDMAADAAQPLHHRLATWLLFRDVRGETPEEMKEVLRTAAESPAPGAARIPPFWEILGDLHTARDQERAVPLVQETFGDDWLDVVARDLPHAAPGMVRPLVDALLSADRTEALALHYHSLLARPMRSPFVLIALTRLAEDGRIEGDFPTPAQRAQALVELAVNLNQQKKGNNVMTRAHQRLVELLVKGEPPLLERLMVDAPPATLRTLANMLQRGVDDAIDAVVTDVILEVAPEVIHGGDMPFWHEETTIWTTNQGLRKREGELRDLHDEKIPANREAIARAASYGDLSENAEWEQAIEEQRQLTEAASQIERELRSVSLIEQAPIPEDTVCPGTAVRYREVDSGEERRMVILGPWDGEVPDAVSYRAPLAQGMLGLHAGDAATVQLPQGPLDVQVLGVDMADLGD